MGKKGRLVAVGILTTGESIEVEYQRPWDARGDSLRAAETAEVKARRFRAHKDEQKALRAESRVVREQYGVNVR